VIQIDSGSGDSFLPPHLESRSGEQRDKVETCTVQPVGSPPSGGRRHGVDVDWGWTLDVGKLVVFMIHSIKNMLMPVFLLKPALSLLGFHTERLKDSCK
jgi:hypothetical protein